MISSIEAFLKYFDGVNRRAVRDVSALAPEAETWRPPPGEGEAAWSVGEIVHHMAVSRLWFAQGFATGDWAQPELASSGATRAEWAEALNASAARLRETLAPLSDDMLARRIPFLDGSDGSMSAWRYLMMMVEHEVHHRSQVQAYAGLNGWPVQQIFGRTAEQVGFKPAPVNATGS